MLQCYNKGCGQKFDPEKNTETSCQYHPGVPVFHDALKGWSCCSKRSTDFTEFLNIKGCTTGLHSNEKPPEPEKASQKETLIDEIIVVPDPRPPVRKPVPPSERPSGDEPFQHLKVTVAASLKEQLEKLKLEDTKDSDVVVGDSGPVAVGTQCKNNGCRCTYTGQPSTDGECQFHPGVPIFHEGMKFWSCCTRRTSDFDNFLNQEGCEKGNHCWIKTKEQQAADGSCRVDWHQTGNTVCLSIFAKAADPDQSYFKANKVTLKTYIVFNKNTSIFERTFTLKEAIIPESSEVKMLGSKVEINLRKAEPFPWSNLEITLEQPNGSKQDQ